MPVSDGHQDGRQDGHQDDHVWDLMRRQVLYVGVCNNCTSCIQSTMHFINMISDIRYQVTVTCSTYIAPYIRITVHTYPDTYTHTHTHTLTPHTYIYEYTQLRASHTHAHTHALCTHVRTNRVHHEKKIATKIEFA